MLVCGTQKKLYKYPRQTSNVLQPLFVLCPTHSKDNEYLPYKTVFKISKCISLEQSPFPASWASQQWSLALRRPRNFKRVRTLPHIQASVLPSEV